MIKSRRRKDRKKNQDSDSNDSDLLVSSGRKFVKENTVDKKEAKKILKLLSKNLKTETFSS